VGSLSRPQAPPPCSAGRPEAAARHDGAGDVFLAATAGKSCLVRATQFDALLFDRDSTSVADVPNNGDPAAVRPMPGAPGVDRASPAVSDLADAATTVGGVR
jgi:hypothetical protein